MKISDISNYLISHSNGNVRDVTKYSSKNTSV